MIIKFLRFYAFRRSLDELRLPQAHPVKAFAVPDWTS